MSESGITPPTWLDKAGKDLFLSLWPKISDSPTKYEFLTIYCAAWVEFVKTARALKKDGYVIETGKGYKQPHPCVAIQNKAADKIRRFGELLNLSTSADEIPAAYAALQNE